MEVGEIVDFLDWENKRVEKASGKTNEELILPRALKIGEEYGEFINEFLKIYGWQRKDKMINPETVKKDMEEELVDIIISTFLTGRRLGVDIEDIIEKKIEKIKGRSY